VLPDFSFPCSADHEWDWPPCKVVFRVGNQYAECEKHILYTVYCTRIPKRKFPVSRCLGRKIKQKLSEGAVSQIK
ncbi:unnamed protein product, partial [Ascophyllum nodosum]